jgi:protein SCO1/2
VRGKVISVDAKDGVISLDTEAIPGFMEAMTMAYTLQNPSVASELHPGDRITAQLQIGAQGAVLGDIDITQQAVLNALPPVAYHMPRPGELVPDFELLNQSGRAIHLRQFRGKVLVLTFIYTRCASSQFCPLMSRNFAALDELLAADPKLYTKTHLLSISFDPKYDTPAVLRSYGGAYTGRYTKEKFEHWDFAAPSQADLSSLLQWFDVGVTRKNGSVLMHSVSTAVIGPDGKIASWYPTNTWTPQQAFHDVRIAATTGSAGKQ